MISEYELEMAWMAVVWHNKRHCPGICLKGLRKTTRKNLIRDRQSPDDIRTGNLPGTRMCNRKHDRNNADA
jgi:hypothetical protein